MTTVKEKSWSVRLIEGYVLNDQVRADRCKGCEKITQLVVGNNNDPDLILYGCDGHKCKHILIRTRVAPSEQKPISQPIIEVNTAEFESIVNRMSDNLRI